MTLIKYILVGFITISEEDAYEVMMLKNSDQSKIRSNKLGTYMLNNLLCEILS